MLAKRSEVHGAGKCNNPEVRRVDYVAAIELDKLALATRVNTEMNRVFTKRPSANQVPK